MKIVNFTPGLGNQIFEYIFVQYLQKTFPKEKVYGYYHPKFLNKHNGLEVHKIFDIELPPATKWSDFVAFMCRAISRVLPRVKATDSSYSDKAIYYDGWWQNKCFWGDIVDSIKFRERPLSDLNMKYIEMITKTNSVSIHIRRGDYLNPENIKNYGGICTIDYYNQAIDIVKGSMDNPAFFIFSNDIQWVKDNMEIPNPVFIDNNKGSDSYLDMYLMSRCKANIIANSSFSYWGAMLNVNVDHMVVYPKKWFNTHTPDMFPNNWIGL